jgi:uncharacterized protein
MRARLTIFSFIVLLILSATSLQADTNFATLSVSMKQNHYKLQIADTDARRLQGLMFRPRLASDEGMLFVYPASADHRIWMKNTLIPLTVIWMNQDARIVDIKLLLPCKTPQCPIYSAPEPSRFILELNQTQYHLYKKGDEFPELKGLFNSLTSLP